MKKLLSKIWFFFKTIVLGLWYVWLAIIVAYISTLIFGAFIGILIGFGIVGAVMLFVFLRQIWWFISGTGDYSGREEFLLRLYKKVFKK